MIENIEKRLIDSALKYQLIYKNNGPVFFAYYNDYGAYLFQALTSPGPEKWYGPIRTARGNMHMTVVCLGVNELQMTGHYDLGHMNREGAGETVLSHMKTRDQNGQGEARVVFNEAKALIGVEIIPPKNTTGWMRESV